VEATGGCGRPTWAKLSPNVGHLDEIAGAAVDGGAEAVVVANTVMGMAIDPETRRFRLGSGPRGGGVSGPAIHPIAVRAVFDVHRAHPGVPIVGVGGIASGLDAAEMILAGATAVQVGTATFADPRAPFVVLDQLEAWARRQRIARIAEVIGEVDG
jgi:dihydroorotate dehydrogenase (NAD+) catalytic subunit